MKIKLIDAPEGMKIKYRVHVQNIGWMNWMTEGELAGTEGKSYRMEAVEIKLEGAPKGYHVLYQAHVQNVGWQNWVKDGETAGTSGRSLRVEAIKIKLVKDETPVVETPGTNPPKEEIPPKEQPGNGTTVPPVIKEMTIKAQSHVQNIGWEPFKKEGEVLGVPEKELRLEAMKLQLENPIANVKLSYQAHVQNIGWQNWVSDGQVMGSLGSSLRIEGVRIKLENAPKGYSVLYQACVEGEGWQGWVKDGQIAGVIARSKKLTGLKVKLVNTNKEGLNAAATMPKIAIDIGHNAPFDSGAIGIRKEDELTKEVGLKLIEKLRAKGYTVIYVTPSTAVSTKDSLSSRVFAANQNEVDKFISVHFNKANGKASGTEVYYMKDSGKTMAANIVNSIAALGFNNRGIKYGDYHVLRNTTMPAVLIETCFLDSTSDMERYNAENISNAIIEGLEK
jgi:N-acetylmuramoyl-L-alanine amidase